MKGNQIPNSLKSVAAFPLTSTGTGGSPWSLQNC